VEGKIVRPENYARQVSWKSAGRPDQHLERWVPERESRAGRLFLSRRIGMRANREKKRGRGFHFQHVLRTTWACKFERGKADTSMEVSPGVRETKKKKRGSF